MNYNIGRMAEQQAIYLDYLAGTPCLPEVVEAMAPHFRERFHNPQSNHALGEEALGVVEIAREQVAALIGAGSARDVYFTSNATESNNWVIKSVAQMPRRRGTHIVTSQIEHFSVLHPCRTLERQGFDVTYLPVDAYGMIDPGTLKKALRSDTALVTLVHASGEIGTIEPIAELGAVCREAEALFHVDATNTAGTVPIDVAGLNVDLLTISPQAFYGPKGIAALYARRGTRLPPLLEGGTQEEGRRAGTENVPAIVGFGVAAQAAARDMDARRAQATALRDALAAGLHSTEGVRLTGHPSERLPHHVSCVIEHVEGESLLLSLSLGANIFASSGTACSAKALKHSYVLEAMGIGEGAGGSLVFGLGMDNTREEIDTTIQELGQAIAGLRSLSPLA